ncbi:class I mannose-6-phosphate isomerase [Mucilaginibacter sp. RCC_168]|uniref:class I mannose-6-phosphate isomerase n=1 Tax=Mucilaginibacter sp. RCC_168 TaxID=3239221 RepID=UPI0035235B2B
MNSNKVTDQVNGYMPEHILLRKSSQRLMPGTLNRPDTEMTYNIYPAHSLGEDKIFNGYASLAKWIVQQKNVIIDGYVGVFWGRVQSALNQQIINAGLTINWIYSAAYLKPVSEIDAMVSPFLGEPESVWGTKCLLTLKDLFEDEFSAQSPDEGYDINIVVGSGASLIDWNVPIIYIDLPKNELQYRMRAGSITNLGNNRLSDPISMYKRFYFVDWVLLNQHKKSILDTITVIADGQWIDEINWMLKTDLIEGLNQVSKSIIRVRPWFEPGVWGGQWIKQHLSQVNKEVENYAWSFELIVPENGLVFESNGYLLEVSFDFLMFCNQEQVLGRHAAQFGDEFPIRFDFLDTYDGGNLSIQCHPRLKYIQELFGENITQDETYYILDCKGDAQVYLGFREDIDAASFKNILIDSQNRNVEVKINDFVQSLPAKKHDLFLIPNGTIHSAGVNNMVLEISATPYIFTFKMYDWLRLDMDGNPRPINIEHAFKNLDFDRKGNRVQEELIAKPQIIEDGEDWQLVHLPTHQQHFYDVHRIEFDNTISIDTNNGCHVMMLVEGDAVLVETANGTKQTLAYAETFVIPAAAKNYKLTNQGKGRAKVIKAFLKQI